MRTDGDFLEERAREVVSSELGLRHSDVSLDSDLRADLGMDSLDRVEITMGVEEVFGLHVTDEEAESWETVGDLASYLKERVR